MKTSFPFIIFVELPPLPWNCPQSCQVRLALPWPTWHTREHPLPLQGSRQRHCHRRLWHAHPHPILIPLLILHSANASTRPTSSSPPSSALLAMSPPNTRKHQPRMQIHLVCTSHHHLHAPLQLLLFRADNTTTLAQKNPDPNSRVRTGTWFLITPNPLSGVSLLSIYSTIPPLRRLYAIPGLPTCRPMLISPTF